MKYLYVVEHYVPFPQSEYGGLWNVIAHDDEECFDLITEEDPTTSMRSIMAIFMRTSQKHWYLNLHQQMSVRRFMNLPHDL